LAAEIRGDVARAWSSQYPNGVEAAEALCPLAGGGACLLFTIDLVGTGILAVPVLAGSCVDRKTRTGRNPRTGAEIRIPAKRTAKLSVSAALATALSVEKLLAKVKEVLER
jgi:hypothetical protein